VRRKRVWSTPSEPFDQGNEGACVGFGWAGELSATPHRHPNTNATARTIYALARQRDRAMGNNWPEGASVLAGAKTCLEEKLITAYHWAFGIDDVIDALIVKGPVVLGLPWYEGMYETDNKGLVDVSGPFVGGHCIVAVGYWPNHPDFGEVVKWRNSWGLSYGIDGDGYIKTSDLAILLGKQGEACIPTDSRIVARPEAAR